MDINIYQLKDKEEFIQKIVEINFNTWYDFYENNCDDITNIDEYKEYLRDNYKTNNFPINLVAINNNNDYIGSISLLDDDFPEIEKDKIWITELYVEEKYRNKGIGRLLINKALEIAREKELKEIYLSCLDNLFNYYLKIGFNYTGNLIFFNNKKYNIFKYTF